MEGRRGRDGCIPALTLARKLLCAVAVETTPAVAEYFRSRGPLMSDVVHTKKPIAPLSASSRWKSVSITQDTVTIQGGYSTRGEAAPTVQYKVGDTTQIFVELDKNASWFLKGVGGPKVQKGDLKAVEVMQLLRDAFKDKLDEVPGDNAAVAETQSGSQDTEDGVDPMDAMDAMDDVAAVVAEVVPQKKAGVRQGGAQKRPTQDARRALVQELDVPSRPRCVGFDEDDKTVVCVYRKAQADNGKNRNLYLRLDCIEWLLAYAADELACQGVKAASPVNTSEQAANCTAVGDLHLEWDFSAKAWVGKFVAGPRVGTTRRINVHDLNQEVWDELGKKSVVNGYWYRATPLERKCALKEWMILWCAAIARGEEKEFESLMDSLATSSPQRGEKRRWEDDDHTAVAADEVCLAAAVADTAVAASSLDEGVAIAII